MPAIDAHVHLIDLNRSPGDYSWAQGMPAVWKEFLISQLRQELQETDINGIVLVQARQTLEETDWLLGIARQNPDMVRGVVAWFDLKSPTVERDIEARVGPQLVGARHILQAEHSEYMAHPDFDRGLDVLADHTLAYDILVTQDQLFAAVGMVKAHPHLTFVLDHLGKPSLRNHANGSGPRETQYNYWREAIQALADCGNVYCKVSAGALEADPHGWQADEIMRYIAFACTTFGNSRIVFGTNAPVVRDAYTENASWQWYDLVKRHLFDAPARLEAMMHHNAVAAYRLNHR
ncbi:MAG TPA: amidohydrolase family protein [Candidatus Nanoarchaeia archaeon]|nr:amidohydrolase family protein [Candidatus Nanoarchaeia archaeon]